jgi:hypothetical protein
MPSTTDHSTGSGAAPAWDLLAVARLLIDDLYTPGCTLGAGAPTRVRRGQRLRTVRLEPTAYVRRSEDVWISGSLRTSLDGRVERFDQRREASAYLANRRIGMLAEDWQRLLNLKAKRQVCR